MNKCSVTAIVALLLLAGATVEAQETPAPKIPYADLPTPADIMAEFADEPSIVADAKRMVILTAVRHAINDMYVTESATRDPEWKRVQSIYIAADNAILARYGDSMEFDREWQKARTTDVAALRLEFFDRHMPAYAEWSRGKSAAWNRGKMNAKFGRIFGSMGEPIGWIGLGLVLVVFILAARGIPRGIVKMSKDGNTVSFGGKPYSVNYLTGQVLEIRKDVTQEISGGGGGGTIVDGRGTINIEPVKTKTTVTDTLYLADEDGLEHAVKLYDVSVDVRAGHRVTVQWLTARGRDSGPISQVYNHSTRVQFLSEGDIKALLRPSKFAYLLTIGGWIAAWQLLSLLPSEGGFDFGGTIIFIVVAATWIEFFGRTVASRRFGRFRKSAAFRDLVNGIVQEGQPPGTIGVA